MNVIKDFQKILMNGAKTAPLPLNPPFLKVVENFLLAPEVLEVASVAAALAAVEAAQAVAAQAVADLEGVVVQRVMKKDRVALLNK